MLKEHLKYKNISIYKLAKEADVPYSTVNDLVNGKVDIDFVNYKTVRQLAKFFGLSSEQFYLMCKDKDYVFDDELYGKVYYKKNKPYMIIYNYSEEVEFDIELQDFKENNSLFLMDYARYELELKSKELEKKRVLEELDSDWSK